MKDIFDPAVTEELIGRILTLEPETRPLWGRMSAPQMLAHCCVSFELAYGEGGHPRPGPVARLALRAFVKQGVVGEKPYRKNLPTAPVFRIRDERDFGRERERLIGYLRRTSELGADHFDGRDYPSFGRLTKTEWNNLFYKHLDHHLTQFGV